MILDKISTNHSEATDVLCRSYPFKRAAEFGQFLLHDEGVDESVVWNDQELDDNLALALGRTSTQFGPLGSPD